MKQKMFLAFYSSLTRRKWITGAAAMMISALFLALGLLTLPTESTAVDMAPNDTIAQNAQRMLVEGRQIFRYDTFGDEVFWGDTLKLHEAIAQLSPNEVLALGLKVDTDALPPDLIKAIRRARSISTIPRTPSFSFSSRPSSGWPAFSAQMAI